MIRIGDDETKQTWEGLLPRSKFVFDTEGDLYAMTYKDKQLLKVRVIPEHKLTPAPKVDEQK